MNQPQKIKEGSTTHERQTFSDGITLSARHMLILCCFNLHRRATNTFHMVFVFAFITWKKEVVAVRESIAHLSRFPVANWQRDRGLERPFALGSYRPGRIPAFVPPCLGSSNEPKTRFAKKSLQSTVRHLETRLDFLEHEVSPAQRDETLYERTVGSNIDKDVFVEGLVRPIGTLAQNQFRGGRLRPPNFAQSTLQGCQRDLLLKICSRKELDKRHDAANAGDDGFGNCRRPASSRISCAK